MSEEIKSHIKPYITVQRFVIDDFRKRKLTRNELVLYLWLRCNANVFGVTAANLQAIRDDMFPNVGINYINQLLLSLRSKKYLHYETRQGHRGSFEVHFGDWKLPNGIYRSLSQDKETNQVRSLPETLPKASADVPKNSDAPSKKLDGVKNQLAQGFSMERSERQVRSAHNDNDKSKSNIIDNKNSTFKPIPINEFEPHGYEETATKNFALEIGETDMAFLLSVLRKDGFHIIQLASIRYREESRGIKITNPPAYVNDIIQKLKNGK